MNNKEVFTIEGFAGKRGLKGTVKINGAKNAALKAMAATLLFDGPVRLENIPETEDVTSISEILKKLGVSLKRISKNVSKPSPEVKDNKKQEAARRFQGISIPSKTQVKPVEADLGFYLEIDSSKVNSTIVDQKLAQAIRASIVITGPLLTRFRKVSFPAPGGCVIGSRPIDLFIESYQKLGAKVSLQGDVYVMEAPNGLIGTEIFFNKISVGATETMMLAAILAKGTTILKNCAMEPEIGDVAEWLNSCGAKISGIGTTILTILGTEGKLLQPKTIYETLPDRIEAGSFIILGAMCAEELTVTNCVPEHLESLLYVLSDAGVDLEVRQASKTGEGDMSLGEIRVSGKGKPISSYKSFDLRTHEYPGFPTDLQAPLVAFLAQTTGESTVFETIFEGRFKYVEDLVKMGADIRNLNPREIFIKGPAKLRALPEGESLRAHDIRAGFALVASALSGYGSFTINNINLIDRGYEKLEERLKSLGAKIERRSVC